MLKKNKYLKRRFKKTPICYWDGAINDWVRTDCRACPNYPKKTMAFYSGWFFFTMMLLACGVAWIYLSYNYPDLMISVESEMHRSFLENRMNSMIGTSYLINETADIIVEGCDNNKTCEVIKTHYVLRNIYTYVGDVREEYRTPEDSIYYLAGDCEDVAIAYCSLMKARGIKCRIEITNNHAYSVVNINGESIPVDVVNSDVIGRFSEWL